MHRNPPALSGCELLRAVARPSVTDAQICGLAQSIHDWDDLLHASKQHRVLPLLFARLMQASASLPLEVQQRLQSEYQHNAFHCMANAAELLAILEAFKKHSIPVMPFKGVVLAASVYGDANARAAGDLDLLVHPRDLKRASELLLDRGYELDTPVRADLSPVNRESFESLFVRARDGMVAELRTRLDLLGTRSDHNLGMDWIWPRHRTAVLAGVDVPDIHPETALLMLCMHGSKHWWTRLAWIVDVAQLLRSRPNLDWEEIDRESKRTGLWRTVALGVLLAHRVTGVAVPQATLRRFESVRAIRGLVQYIDEHLFESALRKPPGFTPYAIRILGFRDRFRIILSLDLFRPDPRDYAFVKLPRSLHALYYLVRPLRLLLDRSAR